MGRLLEALCAEVGPAATPATSATPLRVAPEMSQSRRSRKDDESEKGLSPAGDVAESQESQGVLFNTVGVRARLLAWAERLGGDPAQIRALSELDLAAYASTSDHLLLGFVELMMDTADRHAGRVPAGDTAPILCARCGPVWAHPSIAAALPMVSGWARALGCPWCHVRKAADYIPRPRVSCERCLHFTPDIVSPAGGVGICTKGHGTQYPMARHVCPDLIPSMRPSE